MPQPRQAHRHIHGATANMGAGRGDIADDFVYEGFPNHCEHANKLASRHVKTPARTTGVGPQAETRPV
ncbi:hypothetical protein GCM10009582_05710 [Arthrobacter flavus]